MRPGGADLDRRAGFLLAGIATSSVGTGLTAPFLLIYLSEARGLPLATVGVLLAVPAACGIALVAWTGWLVDRLGALPVLAGALVAMAASSLVLAFADSVAAAAVALSLAGAGSTAYYPAAQTLIVMIVEPARRQRYFALQFTCLNLGYGFGGILAAVVVTSQAASSFQPLFLLDAATFVPLLLLTVAALKRPIAGDDGAEDAEEDMSAGGYRVVLRDRTFWVVLTMSFFGVLGGYAQLEGGWAAFVTSHDVSASVVGVAFAANTVTIVALQLLVARVLPRVSHASALALSFVFSISMWLVVGAGVGAASDGVRDALVVSSLVVFALGEMLLAPTAPVIVNDLAGDDLRGRYNALYSLSAQIAGVLAPPMATLLIVYGSTTLFVVAMCSALAVALGASLVLRGALASTPAAEPI